LGIGLAAAGGKVGEKSVCSDRVDMPSCHIWKLYTMMESIDAKINAIKPALNSIIPLLANQGKTKRTNTALIRKKTYAF